MNFLALTFILTAAFQTGAKTVWDGVYSAEQATRGKAAFEQRCARCHGDNFQGGQSPPLRTDRFLDHWREGVVQDLYDKISMSMPPGGGEGITEANYLEIVSAILQANGFPAGNQDLSRSDLKQIQIVSQDGPKAVPNNSLVQAVGCLSQNADESWILTDVAEPIRNRFGDEITRDELQAAQNMQPGGLTFRLQNIQFIGFDAKPHKGHKMFVKGVIFRNATNNRINVTAIGVIGEACNP